MKIMKNKRVIFFDLIIGTLILMIGFKIMFPNALGGSAAPSDTSDISDTSDTSDVSFAHFDSLYEIGALPLRLGSDMVSVYTLVSDSPTMRLSRFSEAEIEPEDIVETNGIPFCYVGDTLYYLYHLPTQAQRYLVGIEYIDGDYDYWVLDCIF